VPGQVKKKEKKGKNEGSRCSHRRTGAEEAVVSLKK